MTAELDGIWNYMMAELDFDVEGTVSCLPESLEPCLDNPTHAGAH